ncbi:Uncharacterised protein [Clostridium putrefaciens]|uniref:Uncharacterized protein n=1 Tax=Clostridium putrefaciens TaxID=99675 RepID=A0A381JAI0_9CLOT|nr:hypothetical protein [Clostridium putrefaciens]SUY48013.1 Uncharacterised protein [Clostridium putrefaciens]
MKLFQNLMDETLEVEDLEELESAADLFQFGAEKGYYNKRQSDEFNKCYWDIKHRFLAKELAENIKINRLDLINIIANAPVEIKNDRKELSFYVNGRIKALKGKITGLR